MALPADKTHRALAGGTSRPVAQLIAPRVAFHYRPRFFAALVAPGFFVFLPTFADHRTLRLVGRG
jgi:hypothetical protein